MSLNDWDEIKPNSESDCHLLLGNGFNLALLGGSKGLSYKNLAENVKAEDFNIKEEILELLRKYGNNFESLIRKLEAAAYVASSYGADQDNMMKDAISLREALASGVAELHPDKSLLLNNEASKYCGSFLKNFKNLFTLNYDLILYWVILHEQLENIFHDGFGRPNYPNGPLVWLKKDTQNIFYTHGALHLYKKYYDNVTDNYIQGLPSSHYVIKLENKFSDNIVSQVQENIYRENYPLTVVEGDKVQKTNCIIDNIYLKDCMINLQSLTGDIYTFGWAASSEEDEHILEAIGNSSVSKCYFGIFNDAEVEMVKESFYKVNGRRKDKGHAEIELIFYNAATAPIWKPE